MNTKKRKMTLSFILSGIFFALFLVLTVMLKTVDVADCGPNGTAIGLSSINNFFFDLFGQNDLFYTITELIGYFAILVAFAMCFLGLIQLIKRKSLFKVSHRVLCLAGVYALVVIAFIAFEIFIINYRPILIDGEIEASYPSTHTMLVACILMTAIPTICSLFKDKKGLKIATVTVCSVLTAITAIGRLLAGVHWFTDVCASLFISGAIIFLYYAIITLIDLKKKLPGEDSTSGEAN